jgi:hypothetical protein
LLKEGVETVEAWEPLKGLQLYEKDHRLCERIGLLMASWALAYPLVDLKSQLAWSHAWLISNPKRMKKDLIRFLNNWMSSTQKELERRQGDRREGERRALANKPPDYSDVKEEDVVTPEMFEELRRKLRDPGATPH